MGKPKFSIVTVCYNAGDKLYETINTALKQTYDNFEIIIKDGLSKDDSLTKVTKDDRISVYSCKDKGIYDAMNQAVEKITGDYVYFLNCGDSFYDEKVLENVAKYIGENEGKGIYYGDTYKESTDSHVPMPKKVTAFTCYRNIPCHQACFYHASLFKERGYDLEFKIRADYEHFLWCFFKKEVRPVHTGLVIANYEGGGFSESKENQKRDRLEHKMTVNKYMKKSQLFLAKSYMVITLMPLRRALSNSRHFSKFYNGLKSLIYK